MRRKEFYASVEPDINSGCWLWSRSINHAGYGTLLVEGKPQIASRVAWRLYRSDIPDGLFVCHKCDTPACVNPDHLFLGTHLDNMRDRVAKGRSANNKGEANPRAILTAEMVSEMRRQKPHRLVKDIARDFGISRPQASLILSGRRWSHISA